MSSSINNLNDRELLEKIYKIQQEDHQKIKKIHSRIRMQVAFGIFKWVLYIGLAIGLYTFAEPYFENVKTVYFNLREGVDSINEIKSEITDFQFLR